MTPDIPNTDPIGIEKMHRTASSALKVRKDSASPPRIAQEVGWFFAV